jgi:signal transduction histidine kinase
MTDSITLPITSDPQIMIRQLARLVEISVTLNSTLELAPLLEYILESAVELLSCEAVSILLYDEASEQLRFAAVTGSDPDELSKIPVPLDRSIAGKIFTENNSLVINDVARDNRHFTDVGDQTQIEIRSLLGVPMRIRKQKVGVIEAINKEGELFTYSDVKLLSIIASQAAVAINNARMVQELQNANAQLSEADEMKSRFMAVASHELRTPLGIIMGYATFLKEEAQGDLSEHASNVLEAALELRSLVEDMTNMNLIYTGQRDVKPVPMPLQDILYTARAEISSSAGAKNNTLVFDLPDEPVIVNADRKLKLVFVNLLNNAIRFSPDQGEIHIRMRTHDKGVLVEIQDQGIGIPPDKLERIFEQFYQVEDHMTRRYGGLGLGLSIAKVVVDLHGGRIWAESDGAGKGATLKVALPRVQT